MIGPLESTSSVVTDSKGAFLRAIRDKLQEVVSTGKGHEMAMRQFIGDAGMEATLIEIWASMPV